MAGGGSAYDDRVVRARLAQAFGRLIRRQGDRGLFVILSAAMPSRLLRAFPAGVPSSIAFRSTMAIARVEQRLGEPVRRRRRRSTSEEARGPSPCQVELGRSGPRRFRPAVERPRLESGAANGARAQSSAACTSTLSSPARGAGARDARRRRREATSSQRRSGSNSGSIWHRPRRLAGADPAISPASIEAPLLVGHNPGLRAAARRAD